MIEKVCVYNLTDLSMPDGRKVPHFRPLTVGKRYKVVKQFESNINVINDYGYEESVLGHWFQTVDEFRDNQLKKLGI